MAFKVLYKSILHCSVHRVTASILYIVLPFDSIIISLGILVLKESTLLDVMQIKLHDLLLKVTLICCAS